MYTTLEDVIIAAPKLEPFTPLQAQSCPCCGVSCLPPVARVVMRWFGREPSIQLVSWCRGGRPPVEDVTSPIEAMMRGQAESRPVCGDIAEPHLHLKCRFCDFVRLMRTKGA